MAIQMLMPRMLGHAMLWLNTRNQNLCDWTDGKLRSLTHWQDVFRKAGRSRNPNYPGGWNPSSNDPVWFGQKICIWWLSSYNPWRYAKILRSLQRQRKKILHIRQAHNLSAWHGRHGEWCSTDSPGQLDPIAQLLAVGSDWLACLSWKVLQVSSLHTKSYKWNHMTLDQTRKRPLCFWFVHFSSVKMQLGRPQTRSV